MISTIDYFYYTIIKNKFKGELWRKRIAAKRAVDYVHDGMIVGLGTGTTAYWAIKN